MMNTLIEKFPAQLKEAIDIGRDAEIRPHTSEIHNLYIAGLGGSGIGANFVSEFIREESKIPCIIGKGYTVPAFVGENTLAICSSYSGNTEETLQSFSHILTTGAKLVVVSSGGQLIALAKKHNLDFIQLPSGWPSPRACLGYSLVQQLSILEKLNIIGHKALAQVKTSIDLLKFDQDDIQATAKTIAEQIFNKIPIIYTTDRMEAVAVRLRQQINENAKMLCWHHVIPEMNHNELVGWTSRDERLAVLYLRNKDDLKRNQLRMDINKEIIGQYTKTIIDVYSKGNSLIEKSIYFIHLGDWISWFLSELREVDSMEIKVIDYLKSELAKV